MFCQKCGKEIVEDTKFCSNCGAEIGTSGTNMVNDGLTKKEKPAKKIKRIWEAVVGIAVIIFLIMTISGKFDNAASRITNGAYGKGSNIDVYYDKETGKTLEKTKDGNYVEADGKQSDIEENESDDENVSELPEFKEGISEEYKMLPIQAPTEQILNDYHEKGYQYVWLVSHEVEKREGEIGEAGTTDTMYIHVTYVDPNNLYYVTEEIGAIYSYWGPEIG